MTDHVHGEDSYVECDRYNVVDVLAQGDVDPAFWHDTVCYCGSDTVQVARVGFHTDTTEETPGDWPTSFSQTAKAHRCEEHRFDPDEDN